MRRWLRSHLTYANVMVSILAFLVLGGGTALGAFVVSSNSQIGPGTVSGHNPPTGKHANIISGSISDQDVQNLHFVPLTLKNGWAGDCFGSGAPAIAESVEGVVHFRGDMCRHSGSSANPFAVPPSLRPTNTEWLTVDQASASTGRIVVNPSGQVFVDSDPGSPTAAAGFTSLDGVSYTLPY